MAKNRIFFDKRFGFTQSVLDGSKTIELIPVKDASILKAYDSFTLGSRITGLGGYKEWAKSVLNQCPYSVGENVAIAQAYAEIYDEAESIRDLKGFNDRRYSTYDMLKNFIGITKVSLCKTSDLTQNERMSFGIKQGCGFDSKTFSFKTNYYYTFKDEVCAFDTIEDAYFSMVNKAYKKPADSLFYKIEFVLGQLPPQK